MNAFADHARRAIDAVFEHLGVAATYAPPGGGATTACTILLDRREPEAQQGEGRPQAGIVTIEVRRAEIASPAKNGVFAVGATNYTVLDRPIAGDPDGLIWTMWAR
jgi:hypothetical protein